MALFHQQLLKCFLCHALSARARVRVGTLGGVPSASPMRENHDCTIRLVNNILSMEKGKS